MPDGEWDKFMSSLREKLPTTFRLSSINEFQSLILERIQRFSNLEGVRVQYEGKERILKAPTPLPWFAAHAPMNVPFDLFLPLTPPLAIPLPLLSM
jgi:hypothetical protein